MEKKTSSATPTRKDRRGKRVGANEIDQYIGSKIRLRRTMLGVSQQKLGELLALTFQQVQKYERGFSRVGGSRLFQVAQVLEVPVSYFFDGMPQNVQSVMPVRKFEHRLSEPSENTFEQKDDTDDTFNDDRRLTKRETLELARNYYSLPPNLRRTVLSLCRTLAKETQRADEESTVSPEKPATKASSLTARKTRAVKKSVGYLTKKSSRKKS